MTTIEQARERVARGAELLDKKFPGWEGKINLETLNLASSEAGENGCVLCQITKMPWVSALRAVGFRHIQELYGREHLYGFQSESSFLDYDMLDQAWRELLKERFASGNLSGISDGD